MDIPELWAAADLTSKLCRVIWYLRTDPIYTREQIANDLEDILKKHILPKFDSSLIDVEGGNSIG